METIDVVSGGGWGHGALTVAEPMSNDEERAMTRGAAAYGAATALYGLYTSVRPQSLLDAAGLPAQRRTLARALGARDLASGTWIVSGARPGAALTTRVVFDLADAVVLARLCPPATRAKVIAVAGLWGALGAGVLAAGRRR